jgi:protoheme ferro-lyase
MSARSTRHVVMVTYGEPPTPAFLDQLAYSWRILLGLTRKVDAIPRALLPVIALARARARWRLWRQHRYGSPLEAITERQARGLSEVLAAAEPGVRWQMHVAYEYRQPLLADLVQSLPRDEPVWVVPLYAAESAFTHALSREAVAGRDGPLFVLGALSPTLLAQASAAHVLALTNLEREWRGPNVALVLAAHGTVLEPPKALVTGREATEAVCAAIASRLSGTFGMVVNGWLNHTRGGRWTEPPMEQALERVKAAGYSRVVYYPYGFLADNAETELEGRIFLANAGLEAKHLPCLNDSPVLLELLARQLQECVASCGPSEGGGLAAADGHGCARLCRPAEPGRGSCEVCAVPPSRSGAAREPLAVVR